MKVDKILKKALAAGVVCLFGHAANASLIYDVSINQSGQGFGAVANILTFGSTGGQGDSNSVAGGISFSGAAETIFSQNPAGAVDANSNKTSTWSFGQLGLTAASQIIVIWDPAEQGASEASQVDMAVLNVYSPLGALLWTSGDGNTSTTVDSAFAVELFAVTQNPGTGGNGFAFRLDDAQAGSLQTALDGVSGGDFSAYRIGLYAEHSLLDDGPDTWLIDANPGEPPGPNIVPEPETLTLLGFGLLGLYFGARRRRASRR